MRKMSISRFSYRLSSLSAEIEALQGRAMAAGLDSIADHLADAKKAAMKADAEAYSAARAKDREVGK